MDVNLRQIREMKYLLFVPALLLFIAGCSQPEPSSTSFKDVDVAEFKQLIANHTDEIIVDVRTPEETKNGMIEGAIHIDYHGANFKDEIGKLDKSKPILVYCASGGRSKRTQELMEELGFKEVYNLSGGYSAWSGE